MRARLCVGERRPRHVKQHGSNCQDTSHMRHEMTSHCSSDRRSNTRWRRFLHRCDPPRVAGGEVSNGARLHNWNLRCLCPGRTPTNTETKWGITRPLEAKHARTGGPKTVSRRGRARLHCAPRARASSVASAGPSMAGCVFHVIVVSLQLQLVMRWMLPPVTLLALVAFATWSLR